jgi:hypothetical protein
MRISNRSRIVPSSRCEKITVADSDSLDRDLAHVMSSGMPDVNRMSAAVVHPDSTRHDVAFKCKSKRVACGS